MFSFIIVGIGLVTAQWASLELSDGNKAPVLFSEQDKKMRIHWGEANIVRLAFDMTQLRQMAIGPDRLLPWEGVPAEVF